MTEGATAEPGKATTAQKAPSPHGKCHHHTGSATFTREVLLPHEMGCCCTVGAADALEDDEKCCHCIVKCRHHTRKLRCSTESAAFTWEVPQPHGKCCCCMRIAANALKDDEGHQERPPQHRKCHCHMGKAANAKDNDGRCHRCNGKCHRHTGSVASSREVVLPYGKCQRCTRKCCRRTRSAVAAGICWRCMGSATAVPVMPLPHWKRCHHTGSTATAPEVPPSHKKFRH